MKHTKNQPSGNFFHHEEIHEVEEINRYETPVLRHGVLIRHSKIPWYPKLLFQRENALASF
jgi:hypothetical protein